MSVAPWDKKNCYKKQFCTQLNDFYEIRYECHAMMSRQSV